MDSMKSENYFENYGHKIGGMGILSRINQIQPIWLVHVVHSWVGVIRVKSGWGEKWIYLVEIFLVIFHFITTITNKKKKQTKKERKRKIQKQAYTRVDLDLMIPNWFDCPWEVYCSNLTTSQSTKHGQND